MSVMPPDGWLTSVAPPDDAGAHTADRYDWQAAMATADGLRLFFDGLSDDGLLRPECQDWVLCEWHEDWVLISPGKVELVSGKHRDLSAGAYTTVKKLADDGGLAHLFNRWSALQETPYCRLVTSGGLAGSGDAARLVAAIAALQAVADVPEMSISQESEIVGKLRTAIGEHCGVTKVRSSGENGGPMVPEAARDNEVGRFLAALTIHDGVIGRDFVSVAAPGLYARPVLEKMRINGPEIAVWEAVLSLFRERMRARRRCRAGGCRSCCGEVASPARCRPNSHDTAGPDGDDG